jgi:hypothetical protein
LSGPPTTSNPATTALTSADCSGTIYNVSSDSDIDALHWSKLAAGDCVNINYATYTHKFCLMAPGTASAPVIINGVTDASGNRPNFDFGAATATTAPDCVHVFSTSAQYNLETEGGVVITGSQVNGSSDPVYSSLPPPSFIQVQNLELHGSYQNNQYKNLLGNSVAYDGLASGVYIQNGHDFLIDNCIIYDNNYGIFTQSKDDDLSGAVQNLTVRASRVYGNGVVGNDGIHNFYVQGTNPVIEGNFIGQVRAGALGSSYKSRSSGEIFRFNYVVASARALDFVHSENNDQGVPKQPDYGQDYVYGNIIVDDDSTPNGGCPSPLHYGGDNLGEDNMNAETSTVEGTANGPPVGAYRSHLFFFNNLVWMNLESGIASVFALSLKSTNAYAWNNIISLNGTARYTWVLDSGTLNLLGNNLVNVQTAIYNANPVAQVEYEGGAPANYIDTDYQVNTDASGQLLTASPNFVGPATYNFALAAGSPAIDQGTGTPASLSASTPGYGTLSSLPVNREPLMQTNGMSPRTVDGAAPDLGPEEH